MSNDSCENQNKKNEDDSNNNVNTTAIVVIIGVTLVVVSFYFFKFHHGLSNQNTDWGTFGDYVGGILNPVIAAFAFYLIAQTYKLQKTELEATRKAQEDQIKLAALTSLLNSYSVKIEVSNSDNISLYDKVDKIELNQARTSEEEKKSEELKKCIADNDINIKKYRNKIEDLERQIINFIETNA